MPRATPNAHWTLTRYLIEERRRYPEATGDLNALILDVSIACKAIARKLAAGLLAEAPVQGESGAAGIDGDISASGGAAGGSINVQGEVQKPLDVLSNTLFLRMNEWNGHLAGMASEEMAAPHQIPAPFGRGKYLLVFDPLDGSSNIDVDVTVGSIFSILRAPADAIASGRDVLDADFQQRGATQVSAGYALYGPSTMFVLSVGNGVAGFTLDPQLGEFMLTHPRMQVPDETHEFAINSSNARFWEPPIKRYVDECQAGVTGPRNRDFNMRWVASMVAEAHRILVRGGVYLYPRDTKDLSRAGRLRLLYEANPIGFVIEQAGGRASTGRRPVLDIEPSALHQRIGFVFGSRSEVERVERYHREPVTDTGVPLFAERGLFRA